MKMIFSIIGARPQFIKAAPVSRELRKEHKEILCHTGQHYDENMSQLFFDELEIPAPDMNLEIGSGPHGRQTGEMLSAIEDALVEHKPDVVLVYGDTNSTLAGALAACKLGVPIAHVEAGLRSFNREMPEEINRVLTDKISHWMFCPTQSAVNHLAVEGISQGVYLTGDVMLDAALHFAALAEKKSNVMKKLGLKPKEYILATCHRPQNTDQKEHLGGIIEAFMHSPVPVIFPAHPRTRHFLHEHGLLFQLQESDQVRMIEPVGYLDMIQLERNALKIVTDSGGIQKEAYFYSVPCITMRLETEWVETVHDGWNVLAGNDRDAILAAMHGFNPVHERGEHYGDGRASEVIADILKN
jgi:UDP-N-acetylglucosamine 2-epimerase